MKILWITNMIVGDLAASCGIKLTSGQWLNAEIDNEKRLNENEIVICTSANEGKELISENIKYVVLPHGNISNYSIKDEHIGDWKRVFEKEKPDIILVWGTEYEIGKCALIANEKRIPSIIYVQGVMCSIADNYRGGLSDEEIEKFTTVVERIRKNSVFDLERRQQKRATVERECIMLADGVILENDWSEKQYKSISSNLKVYRSRLPIKKEFAEYVWNDDEYEKHSIVTTAANYPLKGLHNLLKAVEMLKHIYPDVKLYIPGPNNIKISGLKRKLLQSGYCKHLSAYIKKNKLTDNVVFTGPLTTTQYAERMKKSHVFVSASAIENHCSALREAMSVGVPCVSSNVGGIPEYAKDRENCTLYNYSDIFKLSESIAELFEDKELRNQYSANGKETIRKMYDEEKLMSMNEIYKEIVNV